MKYKQLTQEQRYTLKILNQEGRSIREMAKAIGVHFSTVSREFSRNGGRENYCPKFAQEQALNRRKLCRKASKLTEENVKLLEYYLRKDWSPEQISGFLKKQGILQISHETIYKFIWQDKSKGGFLYKHLRIKNRRRRKKYGTGKRQIIPNKTYIDDRPAIVEKRVRIGDWELDTIIPGKGGKHVLVTMVDRVSKYILIDKIYKKDGYSTYLSIVKMLRPFKNKVHTLTSDNGTEFRCHQLISKALDAKFYFAHAYKAWERGLSENTNGLLRQYFPRKMTFESIGRNELSKVCKLINNRPRKTLGFRTPKKVFHSLRI